MPIVYTRIVSSVALVLAITAPAQASTEASAVAAPRTLTMVCSVWTSPVKPLGVAFNGGADGTGVIVADCLKDGACSVSLDNRSNASGRRPLAVAGGCRVIYNVYSEGWRADRSGTLGQVAVDSALGLSRGLTVSWTVSN